jgi:pimeloyl-ACP methyl ester carboxylesterase
MPELPVLFLPGHGGSFNVSVLLDVSSPTLDGWDFPPFVDYGRRFVAGFASAGYTRDSDFFVAFYDWRLTADDAARLYLIPWIDRAVSLSGSPKVVLVAHSYGGLVARSYFQSDTYLGRNDVDRFLTLGTPHRGAAEAYYGWEGGDLHGNSLTNQALSVYLDFLEITHPFQTSLDRLRTIRSQAPGVRDLLPVMNYLQRDNADVPEAGMVERNLAGEVLNTPEGFDSLFSRVQSIVTMAGTGFVTIGGITVGAPADPPGDPPRYPDGMPMEDRTDAPGDGTVTLASAQLDDRATNKDPVVVLHEQLPDQLVAEVLAELNGDRPAVPEAIDSVPHMAVLTGSPVELTVRRPDQDGVLRAIDHRHGGKALNLLVIRQAPTGVFRVHLRGTGSGGFTLGILLIGVEDVAATDPGEKQRVARRHALPRPLATRRGRVAKETELDFKVTVDTFDGAPVIDFDTEATTRNAIERIADQVDARVLSTPEVRHVARAANVRRDDLTQLTTALRRRDVVATTAIAQLVASSKGPHPVLRVLHHVAIHNVAARQRSLGLGLAEQLRAVARETGQR